MSNVGPVALVLALDAFVHHDSFVRVHWLLRLRRLQILVKSDTKLLINTQSIGYYSDVGTLIIGVTSLPALLRFKLLDLDLLTVFEQRLQKSAVIHDVFLAQFVLFVALRFDQRAPLLRLLRHLSSQLQGHTKVSTRSRKGSALPWFCEPPPRRCTAIQPLFLWCRLCH